MKMGKEDFRKAVKALGYQIRFKRVGFEGRHDYHFPVVKKDGVEITGGNVFTKEFYEQHKEVLTLLEDNKIFNIDDGGNMDGRRRKVS